MEAGTCNLVRKFASRELEVYDFIALELPPVARICHNAHYCIATVLCSGACAVTIIFAFHIDVPQ